MVCRDPVDKYISRYYYARHPARAGRVSYNRLKKENSSHVRGLTLEQWRNKNIDDCVVNGDEECRIDVGDMYDLSIVSKEFSNGGQIRTGLADQDRVARSEQGCQILFSTYS
jgi:hypothetical protein